MRLRRWGPIALVFSMLLGSRFPVQADPATAPAEVRLSESPVDALVARLGADAFRDRQLAEDELVARGEPVQAILQETAQTTDDTEIRSRCESALQRIDEAMAIGPTVVTLHLNESSAADAFDALAEQAHIELRPYPTNLWDTTSWPTVTLDQDRVPFWQAAHAIARQTGLGLRGVSSDELRITVRNRIVRPAEKDLPIDNVAVSGPFLITATRLSRSGAIDLDEGAAEGDFSVSIGVLAEPKLRILRAEPIVLQAADDDAGNSLLPLLPPSVRRSSSVSAYALRGAGAWQTNVKLREPARDKIGRRITRLQGSFTATLQTRAETFELDDLFSVPETTGSIAGLQFAVSPLTRSSSSEQYELKVTLNGDGVGSNDRDRVRQKLLGSSMQLFANGRRLSLRGSDEQVVNDRIELSWTFAHERDRRFGRREDEGGSGSLPDVQMVWQVPTASKRVEVPFEFKNLPIP